MNCKYCKGICIRKGFQDGKQKYKCTSCLKNQRKEYTYRMCTREDEKMLVSYNNEGMSISSMARISGISKANVVNKIRELGRKIAIPNIKEDQKKYEMDEMAVVLESKQNKKYVIYAINKTSGRVVDFAIGNRTKENIGMITNKVLLLNPKSVLTDRLNIYPGLIPDTIHKVIHHGINHIERNNLTLRTHLKRLSRKTICFSRSREMLECSLKLYLWAN
jgi:insertion element IS1 protein InsB